MCFNRYAAPFLACLAGIALAATAGAKTVNLDGSTYTTLSAAVAAAYSDADPAVVNITVNSLPTADGQILLNRGITINGDGNNDTIPADILVDMAGIRLAGDLGESGKGYIEISSNPDTVIINNLKIHPNADGAFIDNNSSELVVGIRTYKPVNANEVGTIQFTKVWISGSDSSNGNAFVDPATGADLYNNSSIYKWSGASSGGDGGFAGYANFQISNGGGLGGNNVLLDHCKAGCSYGAALNIPAENSSATVLGGVYGHCGRDGIRVSGTSVTLEGTFTDRLRVVRCTNISGGNSHGVEMVAGGEIASLKYVDVAGCNTTNAFNFRSGHLYKMQYCRALGKFGDGNNENLYCTGASTVIDLIADSTIVSGNTAFNPANFQSTLPAPIEVRDSVFTSMSSGTVVVVMPSGLTFKNCALPSDGYTSETLNDPPLSGVGVPTQISTVSVSPHYLLTLPDYDWSDSQGALNPLNGAGNANVLRPSSASYLLASSTGGPLTGGAGVAPAGISDWMLMEE